VLRPPDATGAPADPVQATQFRPALQERRRRARRSSYPCAGARSAWPQAVAAEIRFLTDQKVEAATLRLSPEHLGPVEVRIDVRDNNVSVSFGVAHGDTQAVLE
jgi:flagellar hook-length control protein FliK